MALEIDPHRLEQRQKQIDFGLATTGYGNYVAWLKAKLNVKPIPIPNIYTKCSKRSWDGQIRNWRRLLHLWDSVEPPTPEKAEKSGEGSEILNSSSSTSSDTDDVSQEPLGKLPTKHPPVWLSFDIGEMERKEQTPEIWGSGFLHYQPSHSHIQQLHSHNAQHHHQHQLQQQVQLQPRNPLTCSLAETTQSTYSQTQGPQCEFLEAHLAFLQEQEELRRNSIRSEETRERNEFLYSQYVNVLRIASVLEDERDMLRKSVSWLAQDRTEATSSHYQHTGWDSASGSMGFGDGFFG